MAFLDLLIMVFVGDGKFDCLLEHLGAPISKGVVALELHISKKLTSLSMPDMHSLSHNLVRLATTLLKRPIWGCSLFKSFPY